MNSTDGQLTHRSSTYGPLILGGMVLVALTLAACGRKAAESSDGSSGRSEASNETEAGDGAKGSGHLHLTGDIVIDRDFAVDGCQIGPPGEGLLSGYHMNAEDGDSSISLLAIVIKNYDKDGPYSPADKTLEAQVGQAMATGNMGMLSLVVLPPGGQIPIGPMLKPTSTLVVTTSANGSKGEAKFTDMESPPSFSDINLKSGEAPHGKRMSGSVAWSCGHVERLDPTMDKAVNGMMNKLMPPK